MGVFGLAQMLFLPSNERDMGKLLCPTTIGNISCNNINWHNCTFSSLAVGVILTSKNLWIP
jgi:hypothetical protein